MKLDELRRWIPGTLLAFLGIAVAVVLSHHPVFRTGMCFNDPSWYFHFGQRVLHGDQPYRDFVFQVGPLPIYVDAAFQTVFGERYVASLYAGLFIKILRIGVVWLIARRFAGNRAASALAVFCVLDPFFSFAHHWSTPYSELFLTLSGLCFIVATEAEGRRTLVFLALAGFTAALVMASRPSSAVLTGLVLFAASTVMLVRKQYFTGPRYLALWAGFLVALLLFAGALAAGGMLGPAIQQMILDGPEKKGIRGVAAVFDAISGGAMVDGRFTTRWRGFAFFIGIPLAVIAASALLRRREVKVTGATVALLLVPALMLPALWVRDASFEVHTDLPRTFLSIICAVAVFAPATLREWFGLEPLHAIALGGLALASDWALEMSFPGRGWGDVWALITATILLTLASSQISQRIKSAFCALVMVAGLVHAVTTLHADFNPFAKPEAADGTLTEHDTNAVVRGAPHPMLVGLEIPEWRASAVAWLAERVVPGSTCFVYANLPSLYDLLDCRNVTRVDTTIADFPSTADAQQVAADLAAHPPDFILAHERMWMSPPISMDLAGDIHRYDSWNRPASMAIHLGLRAIIDQYESLGTVGEGIGPVGAKQAAARWDTIDAVRLYRRITR